MINWFRMKSKNRKKFLRNYKKEKLMFGALKTVEDHNLYASFGLVDGLSENELEAINGGMSLNITITASCDLNFGTSGNNNNTGNGSGSGNNNGSNNGSGNSGGSSGSSSSSSSSSS